ncbi:MAG: VOC family protein [Kribbellaceae bacterium]
MTTPPLPAPWPGSRSPPATPKAPRSSTAICSTGRSLPTRPPRPAAWTTATSPPPAPRVRWAASPTPTGRCPTMRFYILVADVEATCTEADNLGGSVVTKQVEPPAGAPAFAYLRDPAGNMFGVFTPPVA